MLPTEDINTTGYGSLRCLVTGERLRKMTVDELAAANARIRAGTLFNWLGQQITAPLQAALIGERLRWGYRIDNEIPQLIRGEALQFDDEPSLH